MQFSHIAQYFSLFFFAYFYIRSIIDDHTQCLFIYFKGIDGENAILLIYAIYKHIQGLSTLFVLKNNRIEKITMNQIE